MIIVLVTTKEKSLGTDLNQEYWMLANDTLATMMQISFEFIPTKYYFSWKFEPEIKQQIE